VSIRAAVAGLALLSAAACQSGADPRDGGFVSGVVGLSTGGYDAMVEDRQAALEGARDDEARLAARADALAAEQARLEAETRRAAADLAALDRRLSEAERRLDLTEAERDRLASARRDAAVARSRLDRLQAGGGSTVSRSAEVEDLQVLIGSIAGVVEDLAG